MSIFILIVNDFYLKRIFHNQITGKLSDFTGLFAFPFFLSAVFPKHTKSIHVLTALFFLFWKSTLSQPFIDFVNLTGLNTVRIVDFSDNIALISILLSYLLLDKISVSDVKPLFLKFMVCISLFSFVATTQKRIYQEPTYEDGFKKINILNLYDGSVIAIINFKYTEKDLALDTSLNNKFNRLDTLRIMAKENKEFITPIKFGDSVKFSRNFSVTILDTTGKTLLTYNTVAFLKAAEKDVYNKKNPTEYNENWELKIGYKEPLPTALIYGRWKVTSTQKKNYVSFEIREDYYYDVVPDSEVARYIIKDSILTVLLQEEKLRGKILSLTDKNLTVKWRNRDIVKYEKLFD